MGQVRDVMIMCCSGKLPHLWKPRFSSFSPEPLFGFPRPSLSEVCFHCLPHWDVGVDPVLLTPTLAELRVLLPLPQHTALEGGRALLPCCSQALPTLEGLHGPARPPSAA